MKRPTSILLVAIAMLATARSPRAADLSDIRTNLEAAVGGRWEIKAHDVWTFLSPEELPPGLEQGTFTVFVTEENRPALTQARTWMENCQAPFFILGTNNDCVVVTYVPRKHAVSQAIVKAMRLAQPSEISPAEAMSLRREHDE
ncbi:MAG: hypothetical protein JXB04_05650 [Kiritimatiellae bacterium]|nr:hypothetical protein [Kiritimatiellia bacterium]